jgi:hypothetical protein
MTDDASPGAIVEARSYDDANGRRRLSLATRSDLSIEAQITAPGATWIDRQLLAREPAISGGGFGAEVRNAMDRRVDYLIDEGLARRGTKGSSLHASAKHLRRRERRRRRQLSPKPVLRTALGRRRICRRDVSPTCDVASGFAMIDNGLVSAGALAACARRETRPACRGHNDTGRHLD